MSTAVSATAPDGEPAEPVHNGRRRRAPAFLAAWIRPIRRRWRASLQLRTVVITALLTMLATGILALFLTQQMTVGLFQSRFAQVEAEANRGLTQARSVFENANTDETTTGALVTSTLGSMDAQAGTTISRDFHLEPLDNSQNRYVDTLSSLDGAAEIIPPELSEMVAQDNGIYWQSVTLPRGSQDVPGLVFGTQVVLPPGNVYALYFIYDLSSVQETLDYLMRVLIVAGSMLVMLNSLIAIFVSRSVVRPVRQAASTAESLSSGDLSVRMRVRGEDEVARLGTSFNRMADNIEDHITQLADLSQIQQRFVSDVSHELRTPLTTVRMAAEVLYESRESFDPMNRRSTELLYHQVERFQALLADLLEITRFDAGAATVAAERTDLLHLAADVMLTVQPLAENSGTPIHLVPVGSDFLADVDPRRIERIVRNLVNNAIEHGEGQPVDVVVGSDESTVAVAVRDHGIGMSPEQAARVFDRFWRADPARARTIGGSGLGLSIATEDTRLHQGRLDAWGEPGHGSAFRLLVPRHRGDEVGSAPLELPPAYDEDQRRQASDVDLPDTSADEQLDLLDRRQEQALRSVPSATVGPAAPPPSTASPPASPTAPTLVGETGADHQSTQEHRS